MTELRQKIIRAMDLKNLSPHTKRTYLAAITGLAKHYRQSPEKITDQMIEDYLLHLKTRCWCSHWFMSLRKRNCC